MWSGRTPAPSVTTGDATPTAAAAAVGISEEAGARASGGALVLNSITGAQDRSDETRPGQATFGGGTAMAHPGDLPHAEPQRRATDGTM